MADMRPIRDERDELRARAERGEALYVLEVLPGHRQGRGRFWRQNASGYTNDPLQAGLYDASDRNIAESHDGSTYTPVPAAEILRQLQAEAEDAKARLALFSKRLASGEVSDV